MIHWQYALISLVFLGVCILLESFIRTVSVKYQITLNLGTSWEGLY